jgi:hypothetical protein
VPDPRNNINDAYLAFMGMPTSEWNGLVRSLLGGGVLTPIEQEAFEMAAKDRQKDPYE